ncbi:superoxide dismutase [Sorangium sp. So ce131]|uniref:superoxide dismutase n=1 Tax=Sorangium sp. So ce131 TaxID=3133282 RepID=UPI003F5F5F54
MRSLCRILGCCQVAAGSVRGSEQEGTRDELVAADAALAGKSREDLVRTTSGAVFNQAAQVWNHTFYWHSMKPQGGGEPPAALRAAIEEAFGSVSSFKEKLSAAAVGQFGSG